MIRQIYKRSAVALAAAAFAALVPLASTGPASAQVRPHGAAHAAAGGAVHGAMARPGGTMAVRGGRVFRSGPAFRGGRNFAMRRSFGRQVVVGNRGVGFSRFGWRRFGSRRFFGVAGYPLYAYGYGYRRHSCWWYRRFDPFNMPSWCGVYGSSYGYGPGYAYGYGPAFGWGRRFGTFDRRRFAFGGARARPIEGRAALVGGQGGVRFQSGPHNFGGPGAAHFGGGAAHMGGSAHVGGHLNQH